jgi:hypothetical protein
MVELSFEVGAKWVSGHYVSWEKRCLLGAVQFVRGQIGPHDDRASHYLERAIRLRHGYHDHRGIPSVVLSFNDARGLRYHAIAAVLRAAKALQRVIDKLPASTCRLARRGTTELTPA